MSRPRYKWWGYVKGMIREYPKQKEKLIELKRQSITPKLTGLPIGGDLPNPTEEAALKELSKTEQRELESVENAIKATQNKDNGKHVLELIRLVYWEKSHTLYGASKRLHISEQTAKRWHGTFIMLVAKNYGLL